MLCPHKVAFSPDIAQKLYCEYNTSYNSDQMSGCYCHARFVVLLTGKTEMNINPGGEYLLILFLFLPCLSY